MAAHDVAARLLEFAIGGEVFAVERPVRVRVQLLPALVVAVDGEEEGLRVGGVDRDRHVERRGGLPHRVEALVVDLHQRAGGDIVPEIQAEGLKDLQPAGPDTVSLLDQVGLDLRVVRVAGAGPCRLGEDDKAAGVRLQELLDRLLQVIAIAAGDVYHGPDVLAIHYREALLGRRRPAEPAGSPQPAHTRDVGVPVDHRIPGAWDLGLGGVEHALRLVLVDGKWSCRRVLRSGDAREKGGGDGAEALTTVQAGHASIIRVSGNSRLTVRFRTAPFHDRTAHFVTCAVRELKRPRFTSTKQTYPSMLRLCQ